MLNSCADKGIAIVNPVFTMKMQTALSRIAIGKGLCNVLASVASDTRNGTTFFHIEPVLAHTESLLNSRLDEQGLHVRKFVQLAQIVARKSL